MRLSRADILALLIGLAAAVTGLVVWNHGTVDLGMTLASDGEVVTVADVTPGGNAERNGFFPGMTILELTTTDGSEVELGEPIVSVAGGEIAPDLPMSPWWERVGLSPGTDYRLPVEAVDTDRIATAVGGDVSPEEGMIYAYAAIDRAFVEFQLDQSIWVAGIGLLVAALVWRLLAHGLAGPMGRRHALVVASAVAVPGLILPAVQVGTPAGVAAGFLVPAAVALVLGVSMARRNLDGQWLQTALAASLVAAALATTLVVRYMAGPTLSTTDPGMIVLLIAAVGVVPAAIAAFARQRGARERASLLSIGLVPGAAATLMLGARGFEPIVPLLLVTMLLGWYLLPIERVAAFAGEGFSRVRSDAPAAPAMPIHEPIVTASFRDVLTIILFGIVVLYGLTAERGTFVVVGVAMAALVGFAVRSGFIGAWSDAAIPLGVAVGMPVAMADYIGWEFGGVMGWSALALALVGLSVAHVLASRHSDPIWRPRLVWMSAALVVLVAILSDSGSALLVAAAIPLVPGLPLAFANDFGGEARAVSSRMETLVVALTPAIAALVLFSPGWVPLAAWLIAIVVWRRFTLAPLMGIAQRTQLQRDLAVAAAETERARLAADLHDDALQQLTMLVRTLDESGNAEAAAEAREVATKLRAVVGDLRLPILDDLGAGAALEWLVERVEPLAGGQVKLERSDETRPPANVELAVFRVAQEALTNAIKHGKPPIAVRYDVRTDGRVTLAIDDAGPGIGPDAAEEAPREGHFGLANMTQRAEQIGALLDVRRWPSGGTRVALEWRPQ
jgi:signal transduction histidine kinase